MPARVGLARALTSSVFRPHRWRAGNGSFPRPPELRGGSLACDDAVVLPYVAYLRTYEPLAAFPEPDRSAWASYAASAARPSRAAALDIEHERALRHVVAVPPVVVPNRESGDAFVRHVNGTTYVSPWQTRLRSWLALTEFRASMPDGIAGAFVPEAVAEQAANEFEEYKRHHSVERPHILSSTWHVPLQWFVPFDPAERWLVLGSREAGIARQSGATTAAPTRTLVYVTSMAQARRRVARAIAVIRRHLGEGYAHEGAESVGRWLEAFHPRSLVELDYGGLVHLLDDESLRGDQSVADVEAALAALEAGQHDVAATAYERLNERWRGVQRLETAN